MDSGETDPANPDTDGDGMADGWEVQYGLDPLDPADAAEDPDGDGFTNLEEYQNGTDPFQFDLPYRIDVYTDKDTYAAGETMHVGLDLANYRRPRIARLLLLLWTPLGPVSIVNVPVVLPPNFESSRPDLLVWTLPTLPAGDYSWVGILAPVAATPAIDVAPWTFVGAPLAEGTRLPKGMPGGITVKEILETVNAIDVGPLTETLERLQGVEIDLGQELTVLSRQQFVPMVLTR